MKRRERKKKVGATKKGDTIFVQFFKWLKLNTDADRRVPLPVDFPSKSALNLQDSPTCISFVAQPAPSPDINA